MTLKEVNDYTRQLLRDVNRTIFQEIEINRAINEAIDRVRSIKELRMMVRLTTNDEQVTYLPDQYHSLLSLYSASRCFFQDEQMQQATMLMNEFESKLFELRTAIENGDIIITDPNGNPVEKEDSVDYVVDVYFKQSGDDYE